MTSAVLVAKWADALSAVPDRAVSAGGGASLVLRPETPSISLDQERKECVDALIAVGEEASKSNWDGYRARQVREATITQSLSFLRLLPSSLPKPDISAHPSGEIAFEWFISPRRVLTVSINEWGRLSYAALLGQRRHHGTELLLDALPDTIVLAIRELSSHD